MTVTQSEWENAESKEGDMQTILDYLQENQPMSVSEIYSHGDGELYAEVGQSRYGRSEVYTLLQILVHQGEVERREIDGNIYYTVQ